MAENKNFVGIVGCGVYIPRYRITVDEIARTWKKDGRKIAESLNITEKAVAGFDEDACTISVESARRAVKMWGGDSQKIGAVYVGSESHPYAVKPTATIVADAINAGPELTAADLQFACKAGTAGMQICLGLVLADMPYWIDYGLAIGADTAQGRPGDALEYTAASGGAAFIIGKKKEEVIAAVDETFSYTTDTPDFWRRQHAEFPRHGGRFTGEPAYFKHIVGASEGLFARTGLKAEDFDFAVFHQPNGKFPARVAQMLGFEKEKIRQGLVTPLIGNTYSGSAMIGLASILDIAEPGQKILAVSFGSGAGSDAFAITVQPPITKKRACVPVLEMIKEKEYISYAEYAKFRRKLKTL
jgi:hydroxymethylglutaryl-CoA synthase